MSGEPPATFEQIDWEEVSASSTWMGLGRNSLGFLLTAIPILMLGIYNWRQVGPRESVFVHLGDELHITWLVETLRLTYRPDSLDFVFVVTLLLFFWYIVLPLFQHQHMTRYYWSRFRRNRPAVISLGWLVIVFVGGLLGPLLVPMPAQDILAAHQPPVFASVHESHVVSCGGEVRDGRCYGTWAHPLGTTNGGRDVLQLLIHGMTVSMQIGFITTTIVAAIGISFGTVSAYSGGWIDEALMRIVDIVLSFPTLPFYLLILYSFGASLAMFIIVFALFAWGGTARYVRSKALSISEEEYVNASRLSGASPARVIRRHVVPNTASSIITQLTLLIPVFLLAEAQLAFLGLGDSSIPSWGQLIATGRSDLAFAPWIILAPGMALFLTILAFNFLGDALLDALNPEAQAEADR